MSVLYILSLIGVAVFAITGVLAAGRKGFDFFGVVVIALVTAIGGGTIRDILLDRHPVFWIGDTNYLYAATAAALMTLLLVRYRRPPLKALLYADALGLALFTISGTRISDGFGVSPVVAVMMGCITGVAGGVLRDILSAEIPLLLRDREIYATAAILGAVLYLILFKFFGVAETPAALAGMLMVVTVRGLSIWSKLRVPLFHLPEH